MPAHDINYCFWNGCQHPPTTTVLFILDHLLPLTIMCKSLEEHVEMTGQAMLLFIYTLGPCVEMCPRQWSNIAGMTTEHIAAMYYFNHTVGHWQQLPSCMIAAMFAWLDVHVVDVIPHNQSAYQRCFAMQQHLAQLVKNMKGNGQACTRKLYGVVCMQFRVQKCVTMMLFPCSQSLSLV